MTSKKKAKVEQIARMSFDMRESMLTWLREYAHEHDRSVSWVVRHAIEKLMEEKHAR